MPLSELKDLLKENEILLKDEESRSYYGNDRSKAIVKNTKENINALETIIFAYKQADEYNKK